MQLQLPLHMNGRPTHCAYRGCMNPLSKEAFPRGQKFYCDSDCADRSDLLEERLAKERH